MVEVVVESLPLCSGAIYSANADSSDWSAVRFTSNSVQCPTVGTAEASVCAAGSGGGAMTIAGFATARIGGGTGEISVS